MGKSVKGFNQTNLFSVPKQHTEKTRKPSKYAFIFGTINNFCIENNLTAETRELLSDWFRSTVKVRKNLTPEQTDQILIKLKEISSVGGKIDNALVFENVGRSLEKGWLSFYPSSNVSFGNVDNTVRIDLERKELDLSKNKY